MRRQWKNTSISGNTLLRLTALLLALLLWSGWTFAQGNSGTLLTTINNPTPAAYDIFGASVAALGSDRVIVGAAGALEAYLFSLSGTLLAIFTNPPGAGDFAASVAAVGSDRVLVGAYSYYVGAAQAGAAYLFNTNGALVTTFTNPSPATVQAFGWVVAGMGNDQVLIGTAGGAAYLYSTNGKLQTTFTNPAAGGGFGLSLAAVGSNQLLIGAPYNNTGAAATGAAYLYSTNGTLLTTFTNPTPVANDNFGTSVAAVGNDRLLISAIDYGGAFQAGSAYLFSTNGTLLITITNPTPASQTWFAWSVAAVGSDRVIIGGVWDNTGATRAGSAYLFALPYPPLNIAWNAATVSLSWVTSETGLILQQTELLGTPTVWSDTTNSVSVNGLTNVVQQTIGSGITNRYYRLHRP